MKFKERVEENVAQDDILWIAESWFNIWVGWLTYDEDITNVYKAHKEAILDVLNAAWAGEKPPLSWMELVADRAQSKLNTAEQMEVATVATAVEIVAKQIAATIKYTN